MKNVKGIIISVLQNLYLQAGRKQLKRCTCHVHSCNPGVFPSSALLLPTSEVLLCLALIILKLFILFIIKQFVRKRNLPAE